MFHSNTGQSPFDEREYFRFSNPGECAILDRKHLLRYSRARHYKEASLTTHFHDSTLATIGYD
jgi:hypothetical protein